MGSAAGDDDALDRGPTDQARFPGSQIDPVFQLKETADTLRIHIIGNRRTAAANRAAKHIAEGKPQAFKLGTRDAVGAPARPDTGLKQAFIGIDIADPGKKLLVQQSRFDGKAASMEQRGEFRRADGERFGARAFESPGARKFTKFEPAKTTWINKAKFFAARQREARMRVKSWRRFRCGDEQTAGHAKVDDPLRIGRCGHFLFEGKVPGTRICTAQFNNDVFSRAVDGKNDAACQAFCLLGGRILERLAMRSKPDVGNAIAAHALVDAARDGFYLRQFGHSNSVGD